MITINKLEPSDRAVWEDMYRAYIDFYHWVVPEEMYEQAWREFQQDTRMHALGARLDGKLVGFAHFFSHPNTSGPDVCYLQNLFTAPEARSKGCGSALIAAIADWAEEHDCCRVYWLTLADNTTARRLYDKLGKEKVGAITYTLELPR